MPWETPTLSEVRGLVRDHIRGTLPGADASVPNSVLRVMSDAQGALCHLTLQYIDWLALQLLPDTAETEWLDRHGHIWLVNSDGSTGRKMATFAAGNAAFIGTYGTVVPVGAQLEAIGPDGLAVGFETTVLGVLAGEDVPVEIMVRALDAGSTGNLAEGTELSLTTTIDGVNTTATAVNITGGVETEGDESLRARVLHRIRQPPQGGAAHDYEAWALAVPGCTRAWVYPNEMGIGTVTVRVMFDELRAEYDGFPLPQDLGAVEAYIDTVRPVAVKDFWVLAPLKQPIDFIINGLVPNTEAIKSAIRDAIEDMLLERAAPGQTIYTVWKYATVLNAPGVESFSHPDALDDVMESPGHIAVLGDIIYGS